MSLGSKEMSVAFSAGSFGGVSLDTSVVTGMYIYMVMYIFVEVCICICAYMCMFMRGAKKMFVAFSAISFGGASLDTGVVTDMLFFIDNFFDFDLNSTFVVLYMNIDICI